MQRPASLTVFGILNLIFGVIGVFGIISSYAMLHSPLAATNPTLKIMYEQPGYLAWMKIALPLGLAGTLAAMVSGVGLLKARNWARQLAIGYAIFGIITSVLSLVMTFRYLIGPMLEQARHTQGPEAVGAIGGVIGGILGGFLAIIYPIILLIFITRRDVVVACRQEPPPLPK